VISLSSFRKVDLAKRTRLMMWCTTTWHHAILRPFPTWVPSRSQQSHKVEENPENDPIEVEGIVRLKHCMCYPQVSILVCSLVSVNGVDNNSVLDLCA
jgi:hypothetical protein